ncbi:hypothetical protein D3C71_2091090 [compost metagenome]
MGLPLTPANPGYQIFHHLLKQMKRLYPLIWLLLHSNHLLLYTCHIPIVHDFGAVCSIRFHLF